MVKQQLLFLILFCCATEVVAQSQTDSLAAQVGSTAADDPSQFLTRMELFSEIQHHSHNGSDFYLNQTTLRTIVTIGKRFTTRLDVPFVYNSLSTEADYQQFGLSDISFRLLGYKITQSKRSAFTASIEISLNTAASPILGTGKNILLPVISYSRMLMPNRILFAAVFQEAISFSGDENRDPVSFTKVQPILLTFLSRKMWTVVAPELYIDYVHGGASMNLEGRIGYAPTRRINVWAQVGGGLFGDFIARYQWGGELGCRYFFLRNTLLKRKSTG